MFKQIQLLIAAILTFSAVYGQQNYGEIGSKFRKFGPRNGKLDTTVTNPSTGKLNANSQVAKYDRSNSVTYDNIKIYPIRKLVDVSAYSTYEGNPPKIKMKVYSSAAPGTKVEIQLGKKGDDNYPSGVHSQYEAFTTKKNTWEELTFTFAQIPKGSQVSATEVDKITLLFSPNTNSSDTYYFDDLIGPALISENIAETNK